MTEVPSPLGKQPSLQGGHLRLDEILSLWIQPLPIWIGMDPGQLPLGELPGGHYCPRDRCWQVDLTGKVRPELAITHSA